MAMYAMTRLLLQAGCDVKILAVNSPKCHVTAEETDAEFLRRTRIEWCFIDTSLKAGAALKALLQNRSYHVERFISKDFEQKLKGILQQESFDIIQLETIYPAVCLPVIRKYSHAKVILRAHNIEHKIWERVATHHHGFFKKGYLRILSRQLKQFEDQLLNQLDGITAISTVDEAYFRQHSTTPCITIPYSMDISLLPGISSPKQTETAIPSAVCPANLFSLASMNWEPNLEGIQWFLKECWPRIRANHSQLTFRIAGRHIPAQWHSEPSKGIEIVGEVPDSATFMKENGILIVPLLSGSGIRIKILEGMSLGKVVITTSIGAEGIDACYGKEIIVADTPDAFAEAVTHCLSHPEECRRIGMNAAAFVRTRFDEKTLGTELMRFYQTISGSTTTRQDPVSGTDSSHTDNTQTDKYQTIKTLT